MRNIVTATSNTNTYETNKKSSEKQKKNRRQTTENVIEIEYRTTPPIRTSYKYSSLAGMNVNQFLLNLLKHWNRLHGLYEVLLVYFQCVHEQRREKKNEVNKSHQTANDTKRRNERQKKRGRERWRERKRNSLFTLHISRFGIGMNNNKHKCSWEICFLYVRQQIWCLVIERFGRNAKHSNSSQVKCDVH